MSVQRVLTAAAVVAVCGAGSALATHAPAIDPTTVQEGYLVSHSRIARFPAIDLARAARLRRLDVFVTHGDLAAGEATPWHTHPGPAVLSVVSGSLTVLEAHHGTCRTRTYHAGTGFVDRGFGHVHRAIAGSEGAHTYVVYLQPRRTETPTTPTSAPSGCPA